jgi:hypothetical protein
MYMYVCMYVYIYIFIYMKTQSMIWLVYQGTGLLLSSAIVPFNLPCMYVCIYIYIYIYMKTQVWFGLCIRELACCCQVPSCLLTYRLLSLRNGATHPCCYVRTVWWWADTYIFWYAHVQNYSHLPSLRNAEGRIPIVSLVMIFIHTHKYNTHREIYIHIYNGDMCM